MHGKLAIRGLLAITATLWLARPVEAGMPTQDNNEQLNLEQSESGSNDSPANDSPAKVTTHDKTNGSSRS